MPYFALLDDNNIVLDVFPGRDEDDGREDYLTQRTGNVYKQTSYNTRGGVHYDPNTGRPSDDQSKAFRKNYASKGFTYNEELDAFIPPRPDHFPSWIFNDQTCLWEPPTPMPGEWTETTRYAWNEETTSWDTYILNEETSEWEKQ